MFLLPESGYVRGCRERWGGDEVMSILCHTGEIIEIVDVTLYRANSHVNCGGPTFGVSPYPCEILSTEVIAAIRRMCHGVNSCYYEPEYPD